LKRIKSYTKQNKNTTQKKVNPQGFIPFSSRNQNKQLILHGFSITAQTKKKFIIQMKRREMKM